MTSREIIVSLNEIINSDREEFLDLLEELFFADDSKEDRTSLKDISYEVLSIGQEKNTIVLCVTAHIEDY